MRDPERQTWKRGEGRDMRERGRSRQAGREPPQDQLTRLADEGKGLCAILYGSPLRQRTTPDVTAGPWDRCGVSFLPVAVVHI